MNWSERELRVLAETMTDQGIERFTRLPFYSGSKAARSAIFKGNFDRLKVAAQSGAIEVLQHGGRITGCFAISPKVSLGMSGVIGTMISHSYSKYSATAPDWIDRQLQNHSRLLSGKYVSTILNPSRMASLKTFEKHGFAITSITLGGAVERALTRLIHSKNPPLDLSHLGLLIEPLTNENDVGPIVRLKKREFTRNPQFGFFASSKEFLEEDRLELVDSCTNPKIHGFVVKRANKNTVVGHFSCNINRNPLWKTSAGVEITLDQSIQGQGVAKTAYRIMLETLSDKNVKVFAGGTSQPSVMGLAKIMDRRPLGYLLFRNRKYFESDHFDYRR